MSVKPSVFLQIKLDILQAPEGESTQTYTSTVEESNIKYVNQIPTPEYVNARVDCSWNDWRLSGTIKMK